MTPLATSETVVDCPLCGQQFLRLTRNGNVNYFEGDPENTPGMHCPFGDQSRRGNGHDRRPQSTPDGCFKDLVVKIHELHQLERRSYDGAILAEYDCTTPPRDNLCTAATPASISVSRQAFVTISARLARFMQSRDVQEHMCSACGHACCEPTRGGCGLCADCVASGLTG